MAYSDNVQELIISQYRSSPKFISFIQSLLKHSDELDIEIGRVINERYLDVAIGIQLDIIGEIVGIDREVVDFINPIYFGFDPDPTAKEFENIVTNNPDAGRYRSSDENPVVSRFLSDSEYRVLLGAKIKKNSSNISANELLELTRIILSSMYIDGDTIDLTISETLNASFTLTIGRVLDGSDQAFIAELDLIPRPVGVRISIVYA